MTVLAFAEQRNGKMPKAAYEALSQGRRIADSMEDNLYVCLVGNNVSGLAEEIAACGGDEILMCDSEVFSSYQTETYAAVLTAAIRELEPGIVLMGYTSMGKDIAPRVAERIGAGLISDCTDMEVKGNEIYFIRPMYAGKVFTRVRVRTPVKICTLRPNNFRVDKKQGKGELRKFTAEVPEVRAKVTKIKVQESKRPELTEAEIIVSGGRGLGKAEGFRIVEEVADTLGAAVGASRAAVDAGWRPQQHQVGQTGKVVTPNLYVACGISGAVQHLAGMGSSRCIVAINKDPDANIMKMADISIEGDLYKILPELENQIREFKGRET